MLDKSITQRNFEFAEAVRPEAVNLYENHLKNRKPWSFFGEITTNDEIFRLGASTPDFKLPPELDTLLTITRMTEDGLVYFPENVRKIINPQDSKKESDPLYHLPIKWTSEERRHGYSQGILGLLTRQDNAKIERETELAIATGKTPIFDLSAHGINYIMFQEGDTATPYNMTEKATRMARDYYQNKGMANEARIYEIYSVTMDKTQFDERAHRTIFKGIAKAALWKGSNTTSEDILEGLHIFTVGKKYLMPGGLSIPNYLKKSVTVARSGLFGPIHHIANVYQTLVNDLELPKLPDDNLTGVARKYRDEILLHLENLGNTYQQINTRGPAYFSADIILTIDGTKLRYSDYKPQAG